MAAPALTVPPFTPPSYAVGAAAQSTFAFAFPFWDLADVLVSLNGVPLAPSSYTVTGFNQQAGQQVSGGYGSGQVVLAAAVTNVTVVVDRFVSLARHSVYGAGSPVPASSLNADFNRLTAMAQDLSRLFNPAAVLAMVNNQVSALTPGIVAAATASATAAVQAALANVIGVER